MVVLFFSASNVTHTDTSAGYIFIIDPIYSLKQKLAKNAGTLDERKAVLKTTWSMEMFGLGVRWSPGRLMLFPPLPPSPFLFSCFFLEQVNLHE